MVGDEGSGVRGGAGCRGWEWRVGGVGERVEVRAVGWGGGGGAVCRGDRGAPPGRGMREGGRRAEGATAGSGTGRDGAARQGGRAATSPRTSPAEVTRSCVPAAAGLPGPLRHPASRVPPGPRSRHCLDFRPPPDCLLPPPHFQGDLTWDVGNRALPLDWRGPLGLAPEWTCGSSCPAVCP